MTLRYVWVVEQRWRETEFGPERAFSWWEPNLACRTKAMARREARAIRRDYLVTGTRTVLHYNADDVHAEIEAVREECKAATAEEVKRVRVECEPFAQLVEAWAPIVRAARVGEAELAMAFAAKLDKEKVP